SNTVSTDPRFTNAPTNLKASPYSGNKIRIEWTDNTIGESGFELWRKAANQNWQFIAVVSTNKWIYYDTNISTDVNYSYQIRAIMSDGSYTLYSNEVTTILSSAKQVQNLQVYVTKTGVLLTWNKLDSYDGYYSVERKMNTDETWVAVENVKDSQFTIERSQFLAGQRYSFRIRSYGKTEGSSTVSEEKNFDMDLNSPSFVTAKYVGQGKVQINWQDNSTNEDGFRLYRNVDGGSYSVILTISPNVGSTYDLNAVEGYIYGYYVEAYTNNGYRSPSAAVTLAKSSVNPLKDVVEGSYAEKAINFCAAAGYIKPATSSSFGVGKTITRGEFIAAVIKALNLYKIPVGKITDVSQKNPYYKEVMSALRIGLIVKDKSGKIYPDNAVTREEMSIIIVKAFQAAGKPLKIEDTKTISTYGDYGKINSQNRDKVATAMAQKLLKLRKVNMINPKDKALREEAAYMIYMAIGINP
ncbi:MAG: S-layer homology domain-containing protein, partial [Clostridia bacterium]|nr:S-layer homology domain-containing protein [Clostridia bacterium]